MDEGKEKFYMDEIARITIENLKSANANVLERIDAHERECKLKYEEYIKTIEHMSSQLEVQKNIIENQNKLIEALMKDIKGLKWIMMLITPILLGIVTLEDYIRILITGTV